MQLRVIPRSDNITQLALVGKLDIEGMHAIDMKFHAHTAATRKSTIVDMSEVSFVASLGMGMLIACAKSLERQGAKMVLLNPQETVEKILRTAGVDEGIPIVHSEQEAKAALAL
jgi:anti-sigma B factor antagonist